MVSPRVESPSDKKNPWDNILKITLLMLSPCHGVLKQRLFLF